MPKRETTPRPPLRTRRGWRALSKVLESRWVLLPAVTLLSIALAGLGGFRVQITESAPRGIYRLTNSPVERGALVVVCPPPTAALLGAERGYLHPGPCTETAAPLLKRVVAVPGDVVKLSRSGISLNGSPLPKTEVLERDSMGRALSHPPWGEHRVAPGHVWVLSTYSPRSFDSRYFGPVALDRVVAVAEEVLTESTFERRSHG